MMSNGARMPPLVPDPRATDHMISFDQQQREGAECETTTELGADLDVTDAEGARLDQATETDDDPTDRRPEGPMNRELPEQVLESVTGRGEHDRERGTAEPHPRRSEDGERGPAAVAHHRKERRGLHEAVCGHQPAEHGRDDGGEGDRCHRAGSPLEDQQLDPEERRGDRSAEDSRHPAAGAGNEERPAFCRREIEVLRKHRSDRPAGQDDRPLRAKGSAGADRDRSRDRLQDRKTRFDLAATDEDRLHRFGDAMASDALGPEVRHRTDDGSTTHGNQRRDRMQVRERWRHEADADVAVVEEVGEKPDQVEERERDTSRARPYDERQERDADDPPLRREVGKWAFGARRRKHLGRLAHHQTIHRVTIY
jgi:hypothetical protein